MWRRPAADSNRRLLPSGREEEDAEPRCDRPLYRPLISPRLFDKSAARPAGLHRPPTHGEHPLLLNVHWKCWFGLLDRDGAGCVTSQQNYTEAMYLELMSLVWLLRVKPHNRPTSDHTTGTIVSCRVGAWREVWNHFTITQLQLVLQQEYKMNNNNW